MELVLEKPKLLCAIRISPNIFVPIMKLGIEGSIPSLFCGTGIDYCTSGGSNSKSFICSSTSY
jgi:hypothetical protein